MGDWGWVEETYNSPEENCLAWSVSPPPPPPPHPPIPSPPPPGLSWRPPPSPPRPSGTARRAATTCATSASCSDLPIGIERNWIPVTVTCVIYIRHTGPGLHPMVVRGHPPLVAATTREQSISSFLRGRTQPAPPHLAQKLQLVPQESYKKCREPSSSFGLRVIWGIKSSK